MFTIENMKIPDVRKAPLSLVTIPIFLGWLIGVSYSVNAEITAESVLGEYWKDPLFGEAAGEFTLRLELLDELIWPKQLEVKLARKIQVVFENKDKEMHIMAFSPDPQELLSNEDFHVKIKDTLLHATQTSWYTGDHQHNGNDFNDTQNFVKSLGDLALIVVEPGDRKEVIIRFDTTDPITFFCVLDHHINEGYASKLLVHSD